MRKQLEHAVLEKLIGMFFPLSSDHFLDFPASEVICGPNDRAIIGLDTHFPKVWLVEDYDFTEEEADWLINAVRSRHPMKNSAPNV